MTKRRRDAPSLSRKLRWIGRETYRMADERRELLELVRQGAAPGAGSPPNVSPGDLEMIGDLARDAARGIDLLVSVARSAASQSNDKKKARRINRVLERVGAEPEPFTGAA